MPEIIFKRLKEYYRAVGEVLKGKADANSIFPNSSDVGSNREEVYLRFLQQHAPSKCNIFFGGFLFDEEGNESKQLDVIVTNDVTPRFHLNDTEKSFSPIEGCIAVFSIKSKLDKAQLTDALLGIASIPAMNSLEGRVIDLVKINGYEKFPLKKIYASDGIGGETILAHLKEFYENNPEIPIERRPDYIHVAGKYFLIKIDGAVELKNKTDGSVIEKEAGEYHLVSSDSDWQAIAWTLYHLQNNAHTSSFIMYKYGWLIDKVITS